MTPEEAVSILSELRYKPGWSIRTYAVTGAVVLTAGTEELDTEAWFSSAGERRYIPVELTEAVSDEALRVMDRSQLLDWAFGVFVRRELHEVEEWLRHRGEPIRSPHPGRIAGILGDGTSTPT